MGCGNAYQAQIWREKASRTRSIRFQSSSTHLKAQNTSKKNFGQISTFSTLNIKIRNFPLGAPWRNLASFRPKWALQTRSKLRSGAKKPCGHVPHVFRTRGRRWKSGFVETLPFMQKNTWKWLTSITFALLRHLQQIWRDRISGNAHIGLGIAFGGP